MLRKRQIMAFSPSTNQNSLVCVTTVINMDPIKFCAHRNLLIASAIGSDISYEDITLNFHILCIRFDPPLIPRIAHSGLGRTTHKLMPRATRPYRPLLKENSRVDTHTLIM